MVLLPATNMLIVPNVDDPCVSKPATSAFNSLNIQFFEAQWPVDNQPQIPAMACCGQQMDHLAS